jgi:serine/threonine-protein kinase RsbT
MEFVSHTIESNDFAEAGAASRQIKQHLKRIGADADVIRRTMIAAYEAEMNVVIHAVGGRLQATIGEHQIDVDVVDDGPGIADLDQALCEGFSTASSEARALGFGAGMGLPNIKRNADRFGIVSKVGQGTRLSFTVQLRAGATTDGRRTSLAVLPGLCRDCRRCVVACPTSAVRVRGAAPSVLEHLCIDCTRCIAVCAPEALTVEGVSGDALDAGGLLAVPPGLLAGFGEHATPGDVLARLRDLGFADVVSVHPYEEALNEAVIRLAAEHKHPWPVISPVCPAVVDLVELRFPSLLDHLAALVSPWEALQLDVGGKQATFVVSCPSQRSALLRRAVEGRTTIVTPAAVRA